MSTDAVEFFHEHAGWSYDSATETPEQGRRRSAERMAEAEAWASREGAEYVWEDDWEVWDHVREYDGYDHEPETCEHVAMMIDGEVVASLGCVDDATAEYRRVVEAELAYEAMPAEIQDVLPGVTA